MIEESSKKLHEFYECFAKIDLADIKYSTEIKRLVKKLIDDVPLEDFISLFSRKNDVEKDLLCADEMVIKKTMVSEYILFCFIDKHGMGSVLEKLIPQSIIHKKNSKLNPINWLLWLFGKIVWSEVKVRSEFSGDKPLVDAIQIIKKKSESANSFAIENFFNNKDLHQAVQLIIKRIPNVSVQTKSAQVDFFWEATAPEAKQQKKDLNCSDKSSQNTRDLAGLIISPKSEASSPNIPPPPPPPPPPRSSSAKDNAPPTPLSSSAKDNAPPPAGPTPPGISLDEILKGREKLKARETVKETPPKEQNSSIDSDVLCEAMKRKLTSMRKDIAPTESNNRDSGEWSESEIDPSSNHSSFFPNASNNTSVADSASTQTFTCDR